MLYDTKKWAIRNKEVGAKVAAEMKILRWMCNVICKFQNEQARALMGMRRIGVKIGGNMLNWCGHTETRGAVHETEKERSEDHIRVGMM